MEPTNSANAVPCRCASQLLLKAILFCCKDLQGIFDDIIMALTAIMFPGYCLAMSPNLIAHL